MEERKVAAVAEVQLTRGAKGEYRWEVKTAATDPVLAVADCVGMDSLLRRQYYPAEPTKDNDEIRALLKKEERDGGE